MGKNFSRQKSRNILSLLSKIRDKKYIFKAKKTSIKIYGSIALKENISKVLKGVI